MDEFETEKIQYALLELTEEFSPRDCIDGIEEILEEYCFYRALTLDSGSGEPKRIYSGEGGQGAIFVSYGCRSLESEFHFQETELNSANSILIMPFSVEEYIFHQIMKDINDGEEAEELELEMD